MTIGCDCVEDEILIEFDAPEEKYEIWKENIQTPLRTK